MKILLDECLPRRLDREFIGHEVHTVPQAGWAGLSNGNLLSAMQEKFDVFVTVDSNITSQQNLGTVGTAVLIIRAPSNRFEDLRPLMPEILQRLTTIQKGEILYIG